jgi:hypothetical protein
MVYRMNGMNKPFKFNNLAAYKKHISKAGIDTNKMYYPTDSDSYLFWQQLLSDDISVYYGAFLSDSVEIQKSQQLRENMSCMGRVLRELDTANEMSDSQILKKSKLKKITFRQISSNQKLEFNKLNKRIKILLVYSQSLGRAFKRTFREVNEFYLQHNKSCELIIISLDPIQQLK